MRIVTIPDCHVPNHDKRAYNLALEAVVKLKPDITIQLGDFAENQAVSSHGKDFGVDASFDEEMLACREAWAELEQAVDGALVFLLGNHETMLFRYIAKGAPNAESAMKGYKELLGMDENVHVVDYQKPFRVGHVTYVHDVGHAGKFAAQQSMEAVGGCVVHGHTHRAQLVYGGTTDGVRHFGMSCGWLGDASHIKYMAPAKTRDWQHAIGLVEYPDGWNGPAFAHLLPVVNGRMYFK